MYRLRVNRFLLKAIVKRWSKMKQVQLYTSQHRFVPSSALLDDFDLTALIQV
jgi:hypothetical protein